jgi:hypothetical protein
MRQTYSIEMDDGTTFDVDADARDIRAWEALYDKSFLQSPLSYTEIAQVAYLAAKRTGVLNGAYVTYEEFDRHCIDARGKRGGSGALVANPTRKARTGDSSVDSRSGSTRSRPTLSAKGRKQ